VSVFRCPECDYEYDEEKGDAHLGYPPGTAWGEVSEDFVCPDCAITYKDDFNPTAG